MDNAELQKLDAADPGVIYVDNLLENVRLTTYAFFILTLAIFVTLAEGCDIASVASVAPLVAAHFGISGKSLGVLLGSGTFGALAASWLLSPVADKVGRRPTTLAGLLCALAATVCTTLVSNASMLLIARVFAGVGVGMITPAIFALVAEILPLRMRPMGTMIVGSGVVIGAGFGNLATMLFVDTYGYRASFLVAGCFEAAILATCIIYLPESPIFMARKKKSSQQLAHLLHRLGTPVFDGYTKFGALQNEPVKGEIQALFDVSRRSTTLFFWLSSFCTLFAVFVISQWFSTLLVRAGESLDAPLRFMSIGPFFGAGFTFAVAWITSKINADAVLIASYISLAFVDLAIWLLHGISPIFYLFALLQLIVAAASQFCLVGVVNRYYPSRIRSTGVGYTLGTGRLGALAGSLAGGFLVSTNLSLHEIYGLMAIPVAIASGAILCVRHIAARTTACD